MVSISKNPDMNRYPLLSIIIPYQDNLKEVIDMLQSLVKQSYPIDRLEILLIYNSSFESLKPEIISTFNDVRIELLEERNHLKSPYSARNRGLEKANGDVIVFIDANSTPDKHWLKNGVHCLLKNKYDLVAGRVDFEFGNRVTASKIVDSLTSIDMKKAVEERGVAYTANLFAKKHVFKKAGFFEERTRSGGDVRLTQKAVNEGFKIGFCEEAVIWKKARDWGKLVQKKIRTGRGYFYTWNGDDGKKVWFYNFLRSLKPPPLIKYNSSHHHVSNVAIWLNLYTIRIIEQVAFMTEYFKYNLSDKRDSVRQKEKMGKS